MKLENQVVSLELAKRLKELGVKQESVFGYINGQLYLDGEKQPTKHSDNCVAAFTVAELGEMLPKAIKKLSVQGVPQKSDYYLDISWSDHDQKWRYTYSNPTYNACVDMWFEATEADARAKMLIFLLENKHIEV